MRLVSVGLGVLVLGGFAGALYPLGDSLAVFREPLLVFFALAVIWSDGPRRVRWPLAALAMGALVPHLPLPGPQGPSRGGITVFQQNLLWDREDRNGLLALIRETQPDVLLLQELSPRNEALLRILRQDYPHQQVCPSGKVGEAVLSRLPVVAGSGLCSRRDGIAALQVETAQGPVWMVSLHVTWPWPFPQAAQVDGVLPHLEALDGPVVLAGDFNSVGWSHTLARIAAATRTERIGRYTRSFTLPYLHLPIGIDHMLAPRGTAFTRQQTPRLGSDHLGQIVRLVLP
ncbi:endonuclease/exonuclease/phosphatase family protein [Tropicibacter sp. S64]|uniref:endonuclease/exonuclease/phosphatase family protein n=1 Tax=Tropicibacter sp. S64 TaxID=3415122 RepID=UPI003C7D8B29